MKLIIFAGGTGRRLWPISRASSPKQFEPIVGDRSTLRLAVDRVLDSYGAENILVSTNTRYLPIVREQLRELPETSFIGEPVRRDLAAAVGLAITHIVHRYGSEETVAILWGDNYMTETTAFLRLLAAAERLVRADRAKLVFMGETPRFANNNLGWIGLGETLGDVDGQTYYAFESLTYRPPLEECERMFRSGKHVWNTGYFVTSAGFAIEAYCQHQPEMWAQLEEIGRAVDTDDYESALGRIYPQLEVASFDDAIVKRVGLDQAAVLHGRMGWSDPGTLYALKESINPDTESNVTLGLVRAHHSKDCLLYNYEDGKLLAAVGLEGYIVVNTSDALLVVHKNDIPLVKQLVDGLSDTELESYS